jgi:polyphosphate kinase
LCSRTACTSTGRRADAARARERVLGLVTEHSRIFADVEVALAEEGIELVDYDAVPEFHARLRERFVEEIFPVLTPLAVDPGHPFPYISTLSLSIAVGLRDPESGERRFARVKVPPILPRLLEIDAGRFVLIDRVIESNLDLLFSGMEILEHHLFRVTRNADLAIEEDEADDLLLAIQEELRRRRFGEAVRLEVERSMPPATRAILLAGIGLEEDDAYDIRGMLDLTGLEQVADLERPDLKYPAWSPVTPPRLVPADESEPVDVFAEIRTGDMFVHHPYESFSASVERFIAQAADDAEVLTIKQTLYRTSGDSPIVHSLIRAAERGKQVVVLVEIKARFDEEANIVWARKLETAGAHVVYGLVGLKTHSKTALVVRREGSGLRRYVHIGTGNYNPKTARLYTDLGLLTCRPEIGADVTDLFNVLTGLSRQRSFRRLLVAPMTLRSRFLELVERESGHARAGRPARIVLKLNAVVDAESIEALYAASQAGVDVEVIARGGCSLVPGVEGWSERIRVRSVIGRFLEHSRIWGFENGGRPEWYIGSADLMERNLDRRVEAVVPVEDGEARARLTEIVDTLLADDRRSWQLGSDAVWRRTEAIEGHEGTIDTHEVLLERAAEAGREAAQPHRRTGGHGSLDPHA